jgi:hypothetical protein
MDKRIQIIANKLFKLKKLTTVQSTFAVNNMEEIKDSYLGMEVQLEEIAIDLQELPTDYKLAERYRQIDQEIYEISEWYEKVKKQ